jgi:hypothetical protein
VKTLGSKERIEWQISVEAVVLRSAKNPAFVAIVELAQDRRLNHRQSLHP